MHNGDRHLWKGVVAGAAGGLAAAWVMNQFQTGWGKATEALEHSKTPQGEQERHTQDSDAEDATMKTAARISETVFQRKLSREEKKKLGPAAPIDARGEPHEVASRTHYLVLRDVYPCPTRAGISAKAS